ncbi:MAG: hypothetical protein R3C45_22650 [Phycisphaerales bacterium]
MSTLTPNLSTHAHDTRQLNRRQVEQLIALADYLPPTDRVLIEHILGKGMPVARIAKLYQRPPRLLRRQAQAIIKRMSNKLFRFVAVQQETLPAEVRLTAKYVVLHGMSLRQAAQESGRTLHHVRQHMNTVHATARLFI